MEQYLEPEFTRHDLLRLPNWHACARLVLEGCPSTPFAFETERWPTSGDEATVELIRDFTRRNYAQSRQAAESEARARMRGETSASVCAGHGEERGHEHA